MTAPEGLEKSLAGALEKEGVTADCRNCPPKDSNAVPGVITVT
jgi:hypothetical protein